MPFPDISPIALQLGPLPIRWYSLAYLAGAIVGAFYVLQLLKRPSLWGLKTRAPVNGEQLTDVATLAALAAIIGGRTGYVLFYEPALLVEAWQSLGSMMGPGGGFFKTLVGWIPIPPALMMWKGGMSFHGGLIGVTIIGFMFARRNKLDALVLCDMFACAAPIALFFGRLANFINGELYGRPWDGPWAMIFPADRMQVSRHPSQLYEAALEGVMLFIVIAIAVHFFGFLKKKGAASGLFLAGYGLARIIVENFREPDAHLANLPFGVTMGMILSTPMVLGGLWLIWRAYTKTMSPIVEGVEAPVRPSGKPKSDTKSASGKAGR